MYSRRPRAGAAPDADAPETQQQPSSRPSSRSSGETSPSHRTVRFSPLPSMTEVNSALSAAGKRLVKEPLTSAGRAVRERTESLNETYDQLRMTSVKLQEPVTKKSVKVSVWILVALVLLLLSNVLYLVAFLSLGWGRVDLRSLAAQGAAQPEDDPAPAPAPAQDWWEFGLWQCCRHSDGVCRGPRWPGFFSAARCFAVLGLFGNVFTLAWMLGYTLEKLMDYDPCTVASLITLSFASSLSVVISVSCFGLFWPEDFAHEYHGRRAHLGWAFYCAVTSAFLLAAAGVMGVFEMKSIIMRLAAKRYPAMRERRGRRHRRRQETPPRTGSDVEEQVALQEQLPVQSDQSPSSDSDCPPEVYEVDQDTS